MTMPNQFIELPGNAAVDPMDQQLLAANERPTATGAEIISDAAPPGATPQSEALEPYASIKVKPAQVAPAPPIDPSVSGQPDPVITGAQNLAPPNQSNADLVQKTQSVANEALDIAARSKKEREEARQRLSATVQEQADELEGSKIDIEQLEADRKAAYEKIELDRDNAKNEILPKIEATNNKINELFVKMEDEARNGGRPGLLSSILAIFSAGTGGYAGLHGANNAGLRAAENIVDRAITAQKMVLSVYGDQLAAKKSELGQFAQQIGDLDVAAEKMKAKYKEFLGVQLRVMAENSKNDRERARMQTKAAEWDVKAVDANTRADQWAVGKFLQTINTLFDDRHRQNEEYYTNKRVGLSILNREDRERRELRRRTTQVGDFILTAADPQNKAKFDGVVGRNKVALDVGNDILRQINELGEPSLADKTFQSFEALAAWREARIVDLRQQFQQMNAQRRHELFGATVTDGEAAISNILFGRDPGTLQSADFNGFRAIVKRNMIHMVNESWEAGQRHLDTKTISDMNAAGVDRFELMGMPVIEITELDKLPEGVKEKIKGKAKEIIKEVKGVVADEPAPPKKQGMSKEDLDKALRSP